MEDKTFQHFKGGVYDVLCVATDTDTSNEVVVYQARSDQKIWTRDLEEFEGMHKSGVKRFTKITQADMTKIGQDPNIEIINGLWDVFAEVINDETEITESLVYRNYKRLPKSITGIGERWGWNDTVFRDDAYVWFKENGVE